MPPLRAPVSHLLDHLICLEEEGWGDGHAQCLRGLQVNDEFVLHGLLDGEISGLSPLENLVDIGGGTPKVVGEARPIGQETTNLHELPPNEHGWYVMRGCQLCQVGEFVAHRGAG